MSAQCYIFGVGIACGAEMVEFKVIFFFNILKSLVMLGDSGKEELTFSRKKHEADEGSVKGSHLHLLAGEGWTGNLAHQSFAQDAIMHLVQQSLVWEKQGKGLTKNLREKKKKKQL